MTAHIQLDSTNKIRFNRYIWPILSVIAGILIITGLFLFIHYRTFHRTVFANDKITFQKPNGQRFSLFIGPDSLGHDFKNESKSPVSFSVEEVVYDLSEDGTKTFISGVTKESDYIAQVIAIRDPDFLQGYKYGPSAQHIAGKYLIYAATQVALKLDGMQTQAEPVYWQGGGGSGFVAVVPGKIEITSAYPIVEVTHH